MFSVGDSVMIITNTYCNLGVVGKVVAIREVGVLGVEFRDADKPSLGHSLGGKIRSKNGIWLFSKEVLPVGNVR